MYKSFKNMYTNEIISFFWPYCGLNTLMMSSGWKQRKCVCVCVDMRAHTHTHTHTQVVRMKSETSGQQQEPMPLSP